MPTNAMVCSPTLANVFLYSMRGELAGKPKLSNPTDPPHASLSTSVSVLVC